MIRYAIKEDKDKLKELCILSQTQKEKKFLEYYFENVYAYDKTLISELDNLLVSQVHMNEHTLCIKDKMVQVSYLMGIATHFDYRNRGIMRDLMDMMVDDCSCNHLFTFVEAYHPKLFEKYGFEVIANRKRYVVYAKDLIKVDKSNVSEDYGSADLVSVYKQFSRLFDCYYQRDETYYENYIKQVLYTGSKICVYKVNDEIKGYCVYYEKDDSIEIKEIIYLDSLSLMKLLKYAMGFNPFVNVEVSEGERLEKIFKMSIPRLFPAIMIRVNNIKLYNMLFNSNIKNTSDMIHGLKKPVLLNEKY